MWLSEAEAYGRDIADRLASRSKTEIFYPGSVAPELLRRSEESLRELSDIAKRTERMVALALRFGPADGAHHKAWVIDQMLRIALGDEYERTIEQYKIGDDGPETWTWEEGIIP